MWNHLFAEIRVIRGFANEKGGAVARREIKGGKEEFFDALPADLIRGIYALFSPPISICIFNSMQQV